MRVALRRLYERKSYLVGERARLRDTVQGMKLAPVSYTHLRAHETVLDLVCRLLLEKKKKSEYESDSTDTRTEEY